MIEIPHFVGTISSPQTAGRRDLFDGVRLLLSFQLLAMTGEKMA